MNRLPSTLRVGNAIRHEALSVFPLFADSQGHIDYRVAEQALSDGTVTAEEVSEAGSVPHLLVNNGSDTRVLFLEGEELVGAKQNRIINTSVLVAAHSRIKIPVSCVEQGRWQYSARQFQSSGLSAPTKLRRTLKETVGESIKESRGHRSDQAQVWQEVAALHSAFSVSSQTSAMSDAFKAHQERIGKFLDRLRYVGGATGSAIAIRNRLVCVDVFDKPSTCQYVWNKLLAGTVFDVMEAVENDQFATTTDVDKLLASMRELPWQPVDTVGEGTEFRAETLDGGHASALILDGIVVHASLMLAARALD